MNRTCDRTGLSLVPGPHAPVFRLATTSYGALNPKERDLLEPRESWSRWDTVGRTVYAVDSRRAAFVEALSWARQEKPSAAPVQLSKTAAALGMTVKELAEQIDADWGSSNGMVRGWLPAGWRESHLMYQLDFDPGWWVDITHSDTLMALSDGMRDELFMLGIRLGLTLAELSSDNRTLTSTIAGWLRESITLDDDTAPAGIRFQSKHGAHNDGEGECWAYWMREADAGLTTSKVRADKGTAFAPDDLDFRYALQLHNIEAR